MTRIERDVVIIGAGASGLTAARWADLLACSDMAGKGFQHVDGAIRVGRETAAAIVAQRG